MDENEIYQNIIMDNVYDKYNYKILENSIYKKGINHNCGDELTIYIIYDDNNNIIKNISYHGEGCYISKASTNIMCNLIKGKTKKEAMEYIKIFLKMIMGDSISKEDMNLLKDAKALQNIANIPYRVKCATLAWNTLKQIIEE